MLHVTTAQAYSSSTSVDTSSKQYRLKYFCIWALISIDQLIYKKFEFTVSTFKPCLNSGCQYVKKQFEKLLFHQPTT